MSGCACGNSIVDAPVTKPPARRGASNTTTPPTTSETQRSEYVIQGVASLTFYPKNASATEGSMGGYVAWYDKPQTTSLQFIDMVDGSCEFGKAAYKKQTPDYRGLDVGSEVTAKSGSFTWKMTRSMFDPNDEARGMYYLFPSIESLVYPYASTLTMDAPGGKDSKGFSLSLQTPPLLRVRTPVPNQEGVPVSLEKDLALAWELDPKVAYVSVRINQYDPENKLTLSLSCRFANTGKAAIPAAELTPFSADPTGERTHIYVFSGSYQFPRVEGLEHPMLSVIEAITTFPLKMTK
jgi:hypothetical protein